MNKLIAVRNHINRNRTKYVAAGAVTGFGIATYMYVQELREFADEYIKPEMDKLNNEN